MRRAVTLAVVLGCAASARAQVTVIEPNQIVASAAATVGGDGLVLIAFRELNSGAFRIVHCSNVACTASTMTTLDAAAMGDTVAIATGADGLGVVAYGDTTTSEVRVAHCSDAACTSATIHTVAIGVPDAVAVGSDGLALISFRQPITLGHCQDIECSAITVVPLPGCGKGSMTDLTIGADGFALIACVRFAGIAMAHCPDVACNAPTYSTISPTQVEEPRLVLGADGLGLLTSFKLTGVPPTLGLGTAAHCIDVPCSDASSESLIMTASEYVEIVPTIGPDGLPLVFIDGITGDGITARHCSDVGCARLTLQYPGFDGELRDAVIGADGLSMVVFQVWPSFLLAVGHCVDPLCAPLEADLSVTMTDGSATATPGQPVTYTIGVSNAGPQSALGAHVTDILPAALVDAQWSCVASVGSSCPAGGPGGIDHAVDIASGGNLSYSLTATVEGTATGTLTNTASASVAPPLSDPVGANNSASDTDALDPPVAVEAADSSVLEGSGNALFAVSLSRVSAQTVVVGWTTAPGTATAGADYAPGSGTLSFVPGTTMLAVGIPVVADRVLELTEDFGLQLSAPSHAVLGDGQATGTILDDDRPHKELVQGSELFESLAAWPGPVEDREYYFIPTPPHTSWEVMVDSTSADVVPILVERLDSSTLATLQTATPLAGGSSVSLRWENSAGTPPTNAQIVGVRSGGCATSCGSGAVYRIRARETTCSISRFNNAGGQVTVVAIQNSGITPVHGTLWFWSAAGLLLDSLSVDMPGKTASVIDTTLLDLAGQQGSITFSHDGSYGVLAGKATSIDAAAGLIFDTPMVPRPR